MSLESDVSLPIEVTDHQPTRDIPGRVDKTRAQEVRGNPKQWLRQHGTRIPTLYIAAKSLPQARITP